MSDKKAQLRKQIESLRSSLKSAPAKAGSSSNSWTNKSYVSPFSTGKGAPAAKGKGKGKGGKAAGKANQTYQRQSAPSGKGKGGNFFPGNKTYVRPSTTGSSQPAVSAVKTSQTAKATAKGGQGSGKGGKGSQNKVYVRPSSGAGSTPTASVPSRAPKLGQWKTWSRAKGAQSLHSSVRGASSKKASAPQAAQRMFVKLLAQRRRQTHGKFAKSSRGNQLVRVSSAVEEARKAGIQRAGKQSLQWVRHEVLTAHAENVKVHAENVKARTDKKQKQIVSVGGGMYRRSKGAALSAAGC